MTNERLPRWSVIVGLLAVGALLAAGGFAIGAWIMRILQ
jgi:hypothetical protein